MLQSFCDLRGSNCEAVVTLKRDNQRMVKRLCDVWTPRLSMPKYNTSSHFSPPKKPFHQVFGSLIILSSRYTYHTFRPAFFFFFQKLPLKRSLGNQVFPVSKIAVLGTLFVVSAEVMRQSESRQQSLASISKPPGSAPAGLWGRIFLDCFFG